ncbi:MAG: S1C family serine protease [Persicimonas sp.]
MLAKIAWSVPYVVAVVCSVVLVGCDAFSSAPPRSEPSEAAAQAPPDAAKSDQQKDPQTNDPAPARARHPGSAPAARPLSFADVVAGVRPAVVNLYTRKRVARKGPFRPFSRRGSPNGMVPRERLAESLGSGFIIDDEGHVLTNHHVVNNATEIGVRLFDDRFFKAKIVGSDPKTDVAVLRIEHAEDLPVIDLGDSHELRVGDWVVAVGNPLGLTSTVTAGITSAIGRRGIPVSEEMRYQDFIQTDASINPGNSGGPLVNTDGEVVGINTAISAQGQGIGFAIPINMALEILPQLKKTGHVERSWLGVYVEEIPQAVRREFDLPSVAGEDGGALVTRVVPGGPAADAQLEPGDIILSIDGQAIDDADHLAWQAANLGVGRTVAVEYWRENRERTTELTMGALPD